MIPHRNRPPRPWNVAVLAGGTSAERDVSLRSGAAVAAALRAGGHRVIEIDPAERELTSLQWDALACPSELAGRPLAVVPSHPSPVTRVDVVFLALHGTFGEDGEAQEILTRQGIPFTGSGTTASRFAFSKSLAKYRFSKSGVPTPAHQLIHFTDDEIRLHETADAIGYPLVVKPDCQGSSLGVSIVSSPDRLLAATAECFRFDRVGVIETAIVGDEWTVTVIDDQPLPAIRIETSRGFYDFAAKYDADDTQYLFDASEESLIQRVTAASVAACRAVGSQGIARVDVRVDDEGRPWVLEVNTLPGMTDHSLAPKAAARAGMSMTQLCERALESAFEAHYQRQNAYTERDRHTSGLRRQAG